MGIEIIFILAIAFLVLGPKRLPEVSRQVGRAYAEYTKISNSVKWKLNAEVQKLEASSNNEAADPILDQGSVAHPAMDAETVLRLHSKMLADPTASAAIMGMLASACNPSVPSEAAAPTESSEPTKLEPLSQTATQSG